MKPLVPTIAGAWSRYSLLTKMLSFASIGVVNVAVDVSVFTILVEGFHLPLIPSNIFSWVVAVTGSYLMNSKITFGRETGGLLSFGRYLRFAASGILGVAIGTTVLVILSTHTGIPVAKLVSIAAGFLCNFCMSNFFVFRASANSHSAA